MINTFGEFIGILVSPIDFVVKSLSYEALIGLTMLVTAVIVTYGIFEYRRLLKEYQETYHKKH
ncbi:hypothetical protein [Evansella vedderi]|uniref:hypothetical protein n=1 Tax=Evansella vedderi TaxID=38282 RepID=UPI0027D87A96|nr:hypothetical protein [Evansella vedderi]